METTRRGIEPIDYQGMVEEFMKTSGQDVYTSPRKMTLNQAKLRYDLYIEELEELKAAIASNDRVEQLDALCDIVYVLCGTMSTKGEDRRGWIEGAMNLFTNGTSTRTNRIIKQLTDLHVDHTDIALHLTLQAADSLGFSADTFQEAFRRVHESNMSKFCLTESEANKTIQWYGYKNGNYLASWFKQNDLYVIVRMKDGKILKSINYKPVNLEDLV